MLPEVEPEEVGMSSARLTRVSSWLREQIEKDRLAGASVLIGRRGKTAFFDSAGKTELENGGAFARDTVVRIYSMTKPITTVAAMMLYERGCFQLDDPISKYIPDFAEMTVWNGGDLSNVSKAESPITVRQVMTHTAGFTYGFMQANPVDAAYRERGVDFQLGSGHLADLMPLLAGVPLIAQPGTRWNYSVATDVLGRLVEVWSGQDLATFFKEEIFTPLRMAETGFWVRPDQKPRFAALYGPLQGGDLSNVGVAPTPGEAAKRGGLKLLDTEGARYQPGTATLYSGGGGLVGTIDDYGRFCQMMLNGGELEGARLLSPTTVAFMRTNQLQTGGDMASMGQPVWSETSYEGIGFGLGGAVVLDPVKAHVIASRGEYHWGGAASTYFWIDPTEELFAVFFTQLMPSSTYPLRRDLRIRANQAIVD